MSPKSKYRRQESKIRRDDVVSRLVWIADADSPEAFVKGQVVSVSEKEVEADVEGKVRKVPIEQVFNTNDVDEIKLVDVARLPHANTAAVIDFLRVRFLADEISTYAGTLLLTVNPFKWIKDLYTEEAIGTYRISGLITLPIGLPPHPFAVANRVVNSRVAFQANQVCIVSGESGAGKTETARQLMNFFAYNPDEISTNEVQHTILKSSAFMESVGNAKTLRNNNSSRFGRFFRLKLHHSGGILAGLQNQYLLELSRLDFQNPGERSYHVFYQLTNHVHDADCHLRPQEWYKYLNQSGTYSVPTVNDKEMHDDMISVLSSVMNPEMLKNFLKTVSAVLLCGNVDFTKAERLSSADAAKLSTEKELTEVASLSGLDFKSLHYHVTTSKKTIAGAAVEKALTAPEAVNAVRTMSKVLYATLFDFGVQLINGKISDPVMEPWVGILDIYGFEFFQKNSFEQFLINYANERLQQYFIQYFFIAEKSELEAEGLDSGVIVYEDNAALLAVMDGKTSVLSLLEDTCLQASGTAETFTNNIHQALDKPGDPKLYVKPKLNSREAFGLAHSAAQVEYNTTEFVVKNKLRMPAAICELFKQSSNSFVRAAFEMVDIPDETKMKGRFTGSIFLREIGSLLVLLRSATPHFIRCMKPNSVLKPQIVEPQMLENQLHALAILQAVDIVQKGYAYRAEFSTFLEENQAIQMILGLAGTGDSRAGTETLLTTLGIDKSQWVLGVSKVYIRKEGWTDVDSKFKTMLSAVVPLVETIQNAYKAFKVRDLARRTLTSQKLLQNGVRRYLSVRDLLTRRKLANFVFGLSLLCCRVSFLPMETEAAIRIQACSRGFLTRKRYANEILRITSRQRIQTLARHIHTVTKTIRWRRRARRNVEERAATGIQALWRGHQGRLQARDAQRQLVLERQCVHIQSVWKGYETRRRVKVLKELHPHITRIQAGWRSYVLRRQIRGRDGERLRDMVQLHRQRRRVQAAARTFHTQVRFSQLHKTGELLQALALPKLLMSQRLSVRWGALTIQAWWRGELVRRRVAASRVRLLVDWKVRQADELTTMESYNGLIFNADGVVIDGKEISVRPRERPDTADVIQLAHDLGKLPCREGLNFLNAKVSVVSVCSRCYPNGLMKTITDISRAHRTGIRQVACGAFHTVVLTLKGHLCVMGISEVLKDRLPTRWRQLETAVPILTVRCGLDFSVAASSSYRLWAWGNNLQGQCGCRPSEAFVSQPTPVLLSSPVSDFSCGAAHSAACGMDGRLHVWGRGSHIGLKATTQDIAAPVALKNLQSAAKVQGGIVGVKCGLGRSYFWTSNGQLFVFGAPRVAGHALGLQGSSLNPNKPARVAGVPPVVTVTCTYYADFALTSSGDIYVWGKLTVTSE